MRCIQCKSERVDIAKDAHYVCRICKQHFERGQKEIQVQCPRCKLHQAIPIVYGTPSEDQLRAEQDHLILLGRNNPQVNQWHCRICNFEFNERAVFHELCPECGSSEIIPIIYGHFAQDVIEASEDGLLYLGGDIKQLEYPKLYCKACKKKFDVL